MSEYRLEHDLLGECSIAAGALHGVHTERALANFSLAGRPVRRELVRAYGAVKLAAARANSAMAVIGHDQMITQAASAGNLERNQFMPLIADSLLTSIDLLDSARDMFGRLCVSGLGADRERCDFHRQNSTSAVTALVDRIGYANAEAIARAAVAEGKTVRELVVERGLLTAEAFDQEISPEAVNRLGSPGTAAPPAAKPDSS